MNISLAMSKLLPGAKWVANPETYEGLQVLDSTPKPTLSALQAAETTALAELTAAETAKTSQKDALKTAFVALRDGTGTDAARLRRVELTLVYILRHEFKLTNL